MVTLTEEQKLALKRVFDRGPIYPEAGNEQLKPYTFEEFCSTVQPTFGMDGAVIVRWARMWLAIEKDGYTHS